MKRVRFNFKNPLFTVSNIVYFLEFPKKNSTSNKNARKRNVGKFWIEDSVYKFKYDDHYVSQKTSRPIHKSFPVCDTVFESEEIFEPFKKYLERGLNQRIILNNPEFNDGNNIFYKLPLVSDKYIPKLRFENVYKNNLTNDDIYKFIKYFGLKNKEMFEILGRINLDCLQNNNLILQRLQRVLYSYENFYYELEKNCISIPRDRKVIILEKAKDFFNSKTIIWDDNLMVLSEDTDSQDTDSQEMDSQEMDSQEETITLGKIEVSINLQEETSSPKEKNSFKKMFSKFVSRKNN